jgi:L-lysine 6-transaminase
LKVRNIGIEKMSIDPKNVRASLDKHILADGFDPIKEMEKSHGSWLVDERDGSEFLDMFSMFSSSAVGYNHPDIVAQKWQDDPSVQQYPDDYILLHLRKT